MIELSNVDMRVGDFSVRDINLQLSAGEYGILMGKSGCGKTTLLEGICGLRKVTSGTIMLSGREVTKLKAADRGIGYVPQDVALFDTMTIRENIGFSLGIRKWKQPEIDVRVEELAEMMGISDLLHRPTRGLSGGEAQRVALSRALAFRPSVLCLDEPLSALDDETRAEMYELLRTTRDQTGVTVLHVTHNVEEAQRLADRLFVMKQGQLSEDTDFRTKRPEKETISLNTQLA